MKVVKKRMKELSSKQKASILILVAVLMVASILSAYFKISMLQTRGKNLYDSNQMTELQWKYVEDSLKIFTKEAQQSADQIALEIKKEVRRKVSSGEFSEGFTKNNKNLESLSLLASEAIANKTLNDLESSGNSAFVATKDGVVSDLALSYAVSLGEERTWAHEIERQHNKPLAEQSINAILKQVEGPIFWELVDLSCDRHISVKNMTLFDLKGLYMDGGLDAFKHYEFLVPSYIEKYGDILKSPDTTVKGEVLDNDKIIVIQRFNLADQINNNGVKREYLQALVEKEQIFIRENEYELVSRTGLMMAVISVFMIFSISLMLYINAIVSKENK